MDLRSQSKHYQFANQKIHWLGQDSEKQYQDNLKKKSQDLIKYGWLNKTIEYQFNNFGFRSIEFQNAPNIVFLGASDTLGTAIPYEFTWANLVATQLNLLPFNLGQGGGSNDGSYRLASFWINELKPKIVILLTSIKIRYELITSNPEEIQTVATYNLSKETKEYFMSWTSNNMNATLNAEKNSLAIQNICEKYNVKFISIDSENDFKRFDYGRDLAHAGINSNYEFANKVLSFL